MGNYGFSGFLTGTGTGGGGTEGANPIRITSADFVDATSWEGANSAGRIITPENNLQVFANYIPRFLYPVPDPAVEWVRTELGFNIVITGFDAQANEYEFYIFIS